jgi:hypothetical protein
MTPMATTQSCFTGGKSGFSISIGCSVRSKTIAAKPPSDQAVVAIRSPGFSLLNWQ